MGQNSTEIWINVVKLIIIFFIIVSAVPFLVWLERRGSAFIQNRLGPNRVGPLGLLQLVADAIKFLFKEEFVPGRAMRVLYYAAPVFALLPAILAFMAIPMAYPLHWDSSIFLIQGFEVNVGIVFVLAVSSLATFSILMAGYGSGNKYALLGALRASAQMISYELALSLSLVGALLLYGSFNLTEIIQLQQGPFSVSLFGRLFQISWLPNWGIFFQPVGAIIFFASVFAESNRLPFDLAEGEAELVAGFHVEYGGFKMLLFFMGEYGHIILASALMTIFYFGGYGLPGISLQELQQWALSIMETANKASALVSFITFSSFFLKLSFFVWIFIQVRWTLPRFRYDQLMNLGWKTMLPWALGNTMVTALFIYIFQ